ncbi:glycerol-3-phosphate dehydrogenase (NAD+) [Enteropsectra breve]|nr:glycerol-3-phosphate dehydrogenase (NAD+) [Enteropsectra breve]
MKVCVVGNGNWGTTVAKVIAENAVGRKSIENEVILWTHEEEVNGEKISEMINNRHINEKYLPGITLPLNIVSRTSTDISDCDVLVFCVPHQFIGIVKTLKIKKESFGISLIKGLIHGQDEGELMMPSRYIESVLRIDCSALMGANIASEVAEGKLCEASLAVSGNDSYSEYFTDIFSNEYFQVKCCQYNESIELGGAVKNVISLAFGIAEGCNWGRNTQAVIFKRGLDEIAGISEEMGYKMDVNSPHCLEDLLTSCLAGRNYKFGIELGTCGDNFEKYEEKKLNGQFLQGPGTAQALYKWLEHRNINFERFPICFSVYKICYEKASVDVLFDALKTPKLENK